VLLKSGLSIADIDVYFGGGGNNKEGGLDGPCGYSM
jgi:hypothetical protein